MKTAGTWSTESQKQKTENHRDGADNFVRAHPGSFRGLVLQDGCGKTALAKRSDVPGLSSGCLVSE